MLPATNTGKTPPPQISHAERDKTPPPKANPPSPSVHSTPFIEPRIQHLRFMPENKHFGFDEYAGLKSEGFSQSSKRSREDDPEAFLGAMVAAKGKKLKPDGSSSDTGGSRDSENIRVSGSWDLMVRNTDTGAYGVINDFNLAAIVTPGQASPTRQGLEQTGTKPFMAIMLLQAEVGEVIQRRCCHDLESVIWCLAWYVLGGTPDWREGTHRQVGANKILWTNNADVSKLPTKYRQGTEQLWKPLVMLLNFFKERQTRVFKLQMSEYSDKAEMQLIDDQFSCPKRPDGEEWDWMDFKVKEKSITKGDRVFVDNE
jgi:hypothetical protein